MQRNVEKYRNEEKCREIKRNAEISMTFMTHENVIFDTLEPPAFRKINMVGLTEI